jgi:hypothetical protein
MGPPKQQPRRRLDPMALLEQATSKAGKARQDMNSTRYMGAIPKSLAINRFSSTMLSPDFNQPLFNCSTVSAISNNSPAASSPAVESMFGDTVKSNSIPWEDTVRMRTIQKSPKGGLNPLVEAAEIFVPPKLELNDETIKNVSPCREKSLGSDSTSFSCTSMLMKKMESYEDDIFNTSDTILKDINSPM